MAKLCETEGPSTANLTFVGIKLNRSKKKDRPDQSAWSKVPNNPDITWGEVWNYERLPKYKIGPKAHPVIELQEAILEIWWDESLFRYRYYAEREQGPFSQELTPRPVLPTGDPDLTENRIRVPWLVKLRTPALEIESDRASGGSESDQQEAAFDNATAPFEEDQQDQPDQELLNPEATLQGDDSTEFHDAEDEPEMAEQTESTLGNLRDYEVYNRETDIADYMFRMEDALDLNNIEYGQSIAFTKLDTAAEKKGIYGKSP